MRGFIRAMLAVATVAVLAPTVVAAQAKPVIAVLYFDNNSIGRDRADFEGVGKGIADLLITDMAQNPNITVVERERVQALLVEQNLIREKTIDPQTAVRIGRIIGAQYMITGGFMSNGRGRYVLTARAINVETSNITNPVRIESDGEDVLAMIADLSRRVNTDMKLPALQVGQAAAPGQAMPAGQPAAQAAAPTRVASAEPATPPAQPAAQPAVPTRRPAAEPSRPSRESAPAKPAKIDIRTAMLYSRALEQKDQGNNTAAIQLFRQVVDRFPDFAPAQKQLKALQDSRG